MIDITKIPVLISDQIHRLYSVIFELPYYLIMPSLYYHKYKQNFCYIKNKRKK